MQIVKNIVTILSLAALAVMPLKSVAQFHLPAQHAKQHNALIANQRPAGVDLDKLKINELRQKSLLLNNSIDDDDEDIFNYNWDSQSIATAYAGLSIPQSKEILVAGYVAPVKGVLTSGFGYRPRFGRIHKGVDLNLHVGDTVVAAFDGRIRMTKYEGKGYGYYVVIRHDNGLETVYGHLSRFIAKPDQYVKAGQPIALGGNTGRSTGPHLHFETRFMGIAINPEFIIDFENRVPHRDVFTFNKSECEKILAQSRGTAKSKISSRKSRRSKSTASSRRKRRR